MEKIITYLCRRKIAIPVIFLIAIIVSLFLLPQVSINYDLAEYLPEDSNTKKAITVLDEEFGYPGTAEIMIDNISISEAIDMKDKVTAVDGVKSVLWLDDLVDVKQPIQFIPASLLDSYYKDNSALFRVEFSEYDYSQETSKAIIEIRELVGDDAAISGPAESSRHMKDVLTNEIFKIIIIVVPICLLILILASTSWIEPFLYLGIIGVSIVINMGTNAFFDSISFMTYSMAAVLQMAIVMDYTLFLMHRYLEERREGKDVLTAVIQATRKSVSSIAASALTTVAGFLALVFMQYKIGTDIGLVLAKGILISFVTVLTLMPVVIILLSKVIDKTSHRLFTPSFNKFGGTVIKFRYVIIIIALIILIPSFLAQRNNEFLFGDSSASSSVGKIAEDSQRITDKFGIHNTALLLVPAGHIFQEISLVKELESSEYVRNVQSLVTMVDPSIPRDFLPQTIKDSFSSKKYSRLIINLNSKGETKVSFTAVDRLKEVAEKYFPGEWLTAGTITSISDIKDTVTNDIFRVNLFSILAVGLIILLTFRSISLPVILVSVILISTWINMSVPYFAGAKLAFIGYLVVSSLQLGATIDYAILLSNRYMDFRKSLQPKEAAISAIKTAGISILLSALILSVAGFGFGFVSQIDEISGLGTLIGRGAALSGFMVLTLLPCLLILLDKIIMKTTVTTKLD